MNITVAYEFLPKSPSVHASMVMDHFGVGFDAGRHVIAENLDLPIQPGDVVLFTGASGSGKSSLLRAAAAQLPGVLHIDALDLGDRILVDGLQLPAEETLALLTSCGLGEAQLMLRMPAELSEGQRYRYRLSRAFSQSPQWIVADEFTATLDRTLAKVIAFNLGKTARRRQVGLLLATTHDDVADDLQPDLHVRCRLDGTIDVERQDVKKKSARSGDSRRTSSASPARSSSRPARNETGRISLAGIIAAINSVSRER